ncbi:TPA: hypothetical protein ACIFCT_003565 [Acinetobacter baumannii]|uniref:hypothetical protein n=1 Tax=Acinetobacter calcoaceticus/baumannii complex TaxID=909768 RepID=UPI0002D5A8DC|nr:MULTISPECIES: hypothetical protein [Acinetobacter calcoaceticus/baumannii complex]EHU3033143.1 hypothetical protein [Acinetobacter baumannii]EHZ7962028.1 hypothetical protein [Acinetobacter baumannii]EIB7144049.1 hypothetical protein [Acinetobacter baumannii]EKT8680437.1 hypothetical protein [Acinetobacter baumannii]EKU0974888.1 hypothetical protein [Acinetobacter baumannii]
MTYLPLIEYNIVKLLAIIVALALPMLVLVYLLLRKKTRIKLIFFKIFEIDIQFQKDD